MVSITNRSRIPILLALVLLATAVSCAPSLAAVPVDNTGHLYTLDGYGGIHPVGSSPALIPSAYWSGFDIARGLAMFADGGGGYTLDGWGGVHAFGSAPGISDGSHAYWRGWDIARAVALEAGSAPAAPAGYTLDGWGGVHAFGGAPDVPDGSHDYWQGWDIARGLVILGGTAPATVQGYILDGYGGLHPFAGGGAPMPPAAQTSAYWGGWDIARSVALLAGSNAGYVMDGYGGLHPFAMAGVPMPTAVPDSSHAYWSGWNIARGLSLWTSANAGSPGGWTMDGYGGVHSFGSAPALVGSAYWSGWDIARSSAGAGSGSGARILTSRVLNVPFFRQVYALSCEAAALEMALGYEGIGAEQGSILSVMGIDYRGVVSDASGFHWGDPYAAFVGNPNGSEINNTGYGTYYPVVAQAAVRLGGRVIAASEGISPQAIYQNVLAGHPSVAWISYDYYPHRNTAYRAFDGRVVQFGPGYEHALLVAGVTETSVLVFDPARGTYWVSKGRFEAAYSVFNDMAVILA